jgi:septin 3/9/12
VGHHQRYAKRFLCLQSTQLTSTVEDETHCEFVYLRNFLTRTHLQDLIETTAQIHYESFRAKQLLALKESSAVGGHSRPISPAAESRNSQRMTMNGY